MDRVIWYGPLDSPTHKVCNNCGAVNCERIDKEDEEEQEDDFGEGLPEQR